MAEEEAAPAHCDKECVDPFSRHCRKSRFEVIWASHFEALNSCPQRPSRPLGLVQPGSGNRVDRILQRGHTGEIRDDFREHLQLLADDFDVGVRQAGDVPARPRQAGDEPGPNWVVKGDHHDGNRHGGVFRCQRRLMRRRDDDVQL
jgi:hypothetical protein